MCSLCHSASFTVSRNDLRSFSAMQQFFQLYTAGMYSLCEDSGSSSTVDDREFCLTVSTIWRTKTWVYIPSSCIVLCEKVKKNNNLILIKLNHIRNKLNKYRTPICTVLIIWVQLTLSSKIEETVDNTVKCAVISLLNGHLDVLPRVVVCNLKKKFRYVFQWLRYNNK